MGFWDIIINPMVTLLTALYALLGNNVVLSIVVLTVAIRLLMYPLLARQRDSMKMQQELQPELKKLQDKYKDDREKLAQAQMELYREHGFNPLSGCLPLFLQFPIFIALYQAIFFAVASTPFQLVDLSERLLIPGLDGLIPLNNIWLGMSLTEPPAPPSNPAYALILPALVAATTWVQFRFTQARSTAAKEEADAKKPAKSDDEKDSASDTMDQVQAMTKSMGTIMPIMFGFISLSLSVGLSIYFITSNLIGILQYSPFGEKYLDRIFGGGGRKAKVTPKDEPEAKVSKSGKKNGKKASNRGKN